MHTASCAALGKLRLKRGKNENEDDEAVSPPKDRPHLAGEKKGFAVCVQIGAQRRESARTSAHCLPTSQPVCLSPRVWAINYREKSGEGKEEEEHTMTQEQQQHYVKPPLSLP